MPAVLRRLIAAEFRKLCTTRLWLWLLLVSAVWTAGYTVLAIALSGRPGGLTPALSGAAGQHALFAIGAGGAAPLAAILAAAGTAGEFRYRTASATFLATPRRARVIAAKLTIYLLAGTGYGPPASRSAPRWRCPGCRPGLRRSPWPPTATSPCSARSSSRPPCSA